MSAQPIAPADRATRSDRILLSVALLGLAGLYVFWFHADHDRIAALLVFALPPLLLGIGALANRSTARFWAGVLALAWFSHGVMVAWAHADQRLYALIETALALIVIFAANASGLRAKFARKT
jgi:uncharacterized membrane protein